jgi:hypothetical protein
MRSKLASRSGKPVKAGGTGTGAGANRASRGSPPVTAPKRRGVIGKKRKMVEAIVPARLERSGLVARMSEMQLQKSVGDVWSQIRSANALSKRAVRAE